MEDVGRSLGQGRDDQSCQNSALGEKNLFLGLGREVWMLLGGSCPWFPVPWKSFPKDQPCQANPIPSTETLLTSGSSRRGLGLVLGSKWDVHPVGCAEGPGEGSLLLPSSSSASWVTLDLSLLLPVPAWPWVLDFPSSVSAREDEELQVDAQISEPQAGSGFPPPEIPRFLCPHLPSPFPAL